MEHETEDNLISRLESILTREREALLAGDLNAIPDLIDEKEEVIGALTEAELEKDQLEPVQAQVSHNQALLEGAMEGIRSVAERMADLRKVRNGLETYDRSGQRRHYTTAQASRLEKRA